MEILKLVAVFAVVIFLVSKGKPMSFAMVCASIATWALYMLPLQDVTISLVNGLTSLSTLTVILVMYCITFLQRMMEARGAVGMMKDSLSSLFNNRWVNCAAAPAFIGLLPSPNAAFIAGDMVKASTDGIIPKEEQAVVTSFFRHISEAFLPTYGFILIALQISNQDVGSFVLAMLPMVAVLMVLGCFFLLRKKVPMETGIEPSGNRKQDFKNLIRGMWTITTVIILVIAFSLQVYQATAIVIVIYFFVEKFKFSEIKPFFLSAFESKIVFNTLAVMVFKELLTATGVMELLPEVLSVLPIPTFLIFVLIFLAGTLVSGTMATIVLCLPMAMVAVPNAGLPLVALLLSISYVAMQVSPTHICLFLIAEYFGVTYNDMVKRTIPIVTTFTFIAIGYYLAWTTFFPMIG